MTATAASCTILRAALGIALAWSTATMASAASTEWVGDANAAVRLVTASDSVGTGPLIEAGIEFRYGPGWHGSWRSPGDAGLAPTVDWSGSAGIGGATLAWPAPKRVTVGDLETYVYEGGVILPVTLERAGQGPARLHAVIRHAACGEVCAPYRAEVTLTLPQGAAAPSAEADALAAARARVPGTAASAGITVAAATLDGAPPRLILDLRSAGAAFASPDLFVEGGARGASPAPRVTLSDEGRSARLETTLADAAPRGRLTLTVSDGGRAFETVLDPAAAQPSAPSIFLILAMALLGGGILGLALWALPALRRKAPAPP